MLCVVIVRRKNTFLAWTLFSRVISSKTTVVCRFTELGTEASLPPQKTPDPLLAPEIHVNTRVIF